VTGPKQHDDNRTNSKWNVVRSRKGDIRVIVIVYWTIGAVLLLALGATFLPDPYKWLVLPPVIRWQLLAVALTFLLSPFLVRWLMALRRSVDIDAAEIRARLTKTAEEYQSDQDKLTERMLTELRALEAAGYRPMYRYPGFARNSAITRLQLGALLASLPQRGLFTGHLIEV
jgi:hypothetical protein